MIVVANNSPISFFSFFIVSTIRANYVIYQTRETVLHRDFQTPRTELKIRSTAEYFWRNEPLSRVFDIFSQLKQKLKSKRRRKSDEIYANWDRVSKPSQLVCSLFQLHELFINLRRICEYRYFWLNVRRAFNLKLSNDWWRGSANSRISAFL